MLKGKAARHTSTNQADEHRSRDDEAGQRLPRWANRDGQRTDQGRPQTGLDRTGRHRESKALGFLPLTSAPHLVATPH